MGNLGSCLSNGKNPATLTKRGPGNTISGHGSRNRWTRTQSKRKDSAEDALIQEQAMQAAILFRQYQNQQGSDQNGSRFSDIYRSSSVKQPNGQKKNSFPRSSSSRPRSVTDPLLQPQQLLNQGIKIDDLEATQFVLVHGGGFGAWCWYKTIALLEEGGFRVTAIDLTGSGVHPCDPNRITGLSHYAAPLTDFLEGLPKGEKVILVGHDLGGLGLSYAMELHPEKVSKAIYVAAVMLTNGQSAITIFNNATSLLQQSQRFLYANGSGNPPTSIELSKSSLKELLFNESHPRDVALASVSMRPVPFGPVAEKLQLSDAKYGSLRRFYIETTEDNALSLEVQQTMCGSSPPERVYRLKGSDHSPFLSKPQALHKLLTEIAKLPSA